MEATSISVVVTVGANQYTIWDEFEGFIDPSIFSDDAPAYLPATAVISTKDDFDDRDLGHITALFSSDDVWNKHFTYGRPSSPSEPWPEPRQLTGEQLSFCSRKSPSSSNILAGVKRIAFQRSSPRIYLTVLILLTQDRARFMQSPGASKTHCMPSRVVEWLMILPQRSISL